MAKVKLIFFCQNHTVVDVVVVVVVVVVFLSVFLLVVVFLSLWRSERSRELKYNRTKTCKGDIYGYCFSI